MTQADPANKTAAPTLEELDFISLDSPNMQFPPFAYAVLKLAEHLTEKETRLGITEVKLSKLMDKHSLSLKIHRYTAKEIREQLWGSSGEYRGGGVLVEWQIVQEGYGRFQPHYVFNFSRILKPTDYKVRDEP